MAGNVWEWTTTNYYTGEDQDDYPYLGEEWEEYEKKRQMPVIRGGSWYYNHDYARCAYRHRNNPYYRYYFAGFRCARTFK